MWSTRLPFGTVLTREALHIMAAIRAEDAILILKHVGGLTSGQTMSLRRGVYQFGPSKTEDAGLDVGDPAVVSFELEVRSADDVILSPGRDAVSIEGRTVSQPVPITAGHTIQAGPDLFVLGAADENSIATTGRIVAPTSPILVPKVDAAIARKYLPFLWLAAIGIIAGVALSFVLDELLWLALAGAGLILAGIVLILRQRSRSRARAENEQKVTQAKGELAGSLMDRRILVAQESRSTATGPADVLRGYAGVGDDPVSTKMTIASGTKPWQPPIGSMQAAGWDPQGIVDGHSTLAAVPFETSLAKPFAVAGPRPAALAFARYVTLAATEKFGADNVAIDSDTPSDWEWSAGLLQTDLASASFLVRDRADGSTPTAGLLITDEPHPVPPGIGSLLAISSSGVARLHDSTGNVIADELIPFGITRTSAAAANAGAEGERRRRAEVQEARALTERDSQAAKQRHADDVAARRAKDEARRIEAETRRLEAAAGRAKPKSLAASPPVPPAALSAPAAPSRPPKPTPPAPTSDAPLAPPAPPMGLHAPAAPAKPATPAAPVRPVAPARQPVPVRADRDATSTTLFSADELEEANALVASVTLDLAHRLPPDRFVFAVLDSGTRPLIRLRQMYHCTGYAALDHDDSVEALLEMVGRHIARPSAERLLLLAVSDLIGTLAYLEQSGRASQAVALRDALSLADGTSLVVVGSTRRDTPPSHDLAEAVMSQVERHADGTAHVRDSRGARPLSLSHTSGQDLTGSVARLTMPQRST